MRAALVLNAPELDIAIAEDIIIAADGGYRHVKDKNVNALIGDFDTLDELPKGIKTIRYPVEKNATDGELGVEYAASIGVTELNIYGGFGGKPEHVLGNLNLLAFADSLGINAVLVSSEYTAYFARNRFCAEVDIGDIVSVFPYGGDVTVNKEEGLYYPLRNLEIKTCSSRGISNVATARNIALDIASGAVIVLIRRR